MTTDQKLCTLIPLVGGLQALLASSSQKELKFMSINFSTVYTYLVQIGKVLILVYITKLEY